MRGPVTRCTPAESHADLHARSTGALAAALTGAQSEVVGSVAELHRAADAAWERATAEPDTEAPTWTRYVVELRPRWSSSRATPGVATSGCATAAPGTGTGAGAGAGPGGGAAGGGWTRELLWP